jgi:uncharacterized repeat protein (TIGR03803 family)
MRGKRLSIGLRALAILAVTLLVTSTWAATTWNEKVLHTFSGTDGGYSEAGLIFDAAGNLYGTTAGGGNFTGYCSQVGCGTVFELTPNGSGGWTEKVLYKFCSQIGCTDGSNPVGGLVMDAAGNLYGTTQYGGNFSSDCSFYSAHGCGTAFELTPNGSGGWTRTALYSFCPQGSSCGDGANPVAGLIFDCCGNLYGTASEGGDEWGTVFALSPNGSGGWSQHVVHYFGNGPDGAVPYAGLVFDAYGNLYGTTKYGGEYPCEGIGCGTVFVLSGGSERVLHSFSDNGTDGYYPVASVITDGGGNVYGTTRVGGSSGQCGQNGCGTVFEVTPGGTETVLYNFSPTGDPDGDYPQAGVISDGAGDFYGTTFAGGGDNAGTVFELYIYYGRWTDSLLYNFGWPGTSGASPYAGLIFDADGNLYGTTWYGGANGYGTVFELSPLYPCVVCSHAVRQ